MMMVKQVGSSLRELATCATRSANSFSYDRTGGNDDRLHIKPGTLQQLPIFLVLAALLTLVTMDCRASTSCMVRMYWDGEEDASGSAYW